MARAAGTALVVAIVSLAATLLLARRYHDAPGTADASEQRYQRIYGLLPEGTSDVVLVSEEILKLQEG